MRYSRNCKFAAEGASRAALITFFIIDRGTSLCLKSLTERRAIINLYKSVFAIVGVATD
jgi:hypothetical protein